MKTGPIEPKEMRKFMRTVSTNLNYIAVFLAALLIIKLFGF